MELNHIMEEGPLDRALLYKKFILGFLLSKFQTT